MPQRLQSTVPILTTVPYTVMSFDEVTLSLVHHSAFLTSVLDRTMGLYGANSALTIVYLSDILPSSKSGALARSVWNTRGWTVQEFLASKIILLSEGLDPLSR